MKGLKDKSKSLSKYSLELKPLHPQTHNKTSQILACKLLEQLDHFSDQQKISLLTSIPILHAGSMIQVIKSVEEVQQLLSDQWKSHEIRLRNQAKFIYHLWQVIDEQQIKVIRMKEIIYLFHQKKGNDLKTILSQMFGESTNLDKLCHIWTKLNADMMYYRQWNQKKNLNDTGKLTLNDTEADSFSKQKFNLTTNFSLMAAKSKEKAQYKSKIKKGRVNTEYSTSQFTVDPKRDKNDQKCDTLKTKKKRLKTEVKDEKQNNPFERLYDREFYQKRLILKEHQIEKQEQQEMKECTFKPKLYESRSRSDSKTSLRSHSNLNRTVKGFDKSINRMKDGYLKQIERKKKLSYINVGENYEKVREKKMNPPRFLDRKKKEEQIILSIGFEINNRKTVIKIRQRDTAESAAIKICQIYGLNPKKYQTEIEEIIQLQIDNQRGHQYQNAH